MRDFCANGGKNLIHRGRAEHDHVCAYHGTQAFDAQDTSYIRCVVFLHYHTPEKAAKRLGGVDPGSGSKVFNFAGDDLWATYKRLRAVEKSLRVKEKGLDAKRDEVHVWQRDSKGEIAIDFCMTGSEKLTPNTEGGIVLPSFIPK